MPRSWRPLAAVASWILISCSSPVTLESRLVNGERRATEAEKLLDQAEREMAALEPDRAEQVLAQAQAALSHPDVGYYPERELIAQRAAADQKKMSQVKREREARDLAIAVASRHAKVEMALAEFRPALAALGDRGIVPTDIDRAKESAAGLYAALEDGRNLEARDRQYGAYARQLRGLVDRSRPPIELAKRRLEFAAGPVAVRHEARDLIARGKSEPNQKKKRALFAQSREKFAQCAQEGQRMLSESPALARAVIMVGGEPLVPRAVVVGCATRARAPKRAPAPKGPAPKGAPAKAVRSASHSRR